MTPQIQAGISGGDGAFAMVGNPAFCTSAIKGLTTVGFKGPVTAIQQCVDQTSAQGDERRVQGRQRADDAQLGPRTRSTSSTSRS